MFTKKETALTRGAARDPFAVIRQTTSDLHPMFEGSAWRLVTKVDLPGMKKEDVKVEVTDSHLVISGERKSEAEEKKEHSCQCEREYGRFYRAIPLPEGVKLEDVNATFSDGVLEVSVPLPAQPEAKDRNVEIQEPAKAARTAA